MASDPDDPLVPHPDNRPYPWLARRAQQTGAEERYLIYQPFAGMCNQFSCLQCSVALARILGRTLVLPRWRPQYGYPWFLDSDAYFDVGKLSALVSCIDLQEFARRREGKAAGAGVTLCRTHLEYNPTWSDPKGFELYPDLQSLLTELEYFHLVDGESSLRLGFQPAGGGGEAVAERRVSLAAPLRSERQVSATWGSPIWIWNRGRAEGVGGPSAVCIFSSTASSRVRAPHRGRRRGGRGPLPRPRLQCGGAALGAGRGAAAAAACRPRPLPCSTTAPDAPARWAPRAQAARLRTPERRLGSMHARRGLGSSAPAAPKTRTLAACSRAGSCSSRRSGRARGAISTPDLAASPPRARRELAASSP